MPDAKPQPALPQQPPVVRMTDDQKKVIQDVAENDHKQFEYWNDVLKQAKAQVEFWEKQASQSSSVSMRATVESWYKEDKK